MWQQNIRKLEYIVHSRNIKKLHTYKTSNRIAKNYFYTYRIMLQIVLILFYANLCVANLISYSFMVCV